MTSFYQIWTVEKHDFFSINLKKERYFFILITSNHFNTGRIKNVVLIKNYLSDQPKSIGLSW